MRMTRPIADVERDVEIWFPSARQEGFKVTSEYDDSYNCIAYAAGDINNWWWPNFDNYWPIAIRETTMACFIEAFKSRGFRRCRSSRFQPGYEKIAIYTDQSGEPKHAARQLPSGSWLSKLGSFEDIEHATLSALEGPEYGNVRQIMKRRLLSALGDSVPTNPSSHSPK
jgi:hypothetical protein